MTPSADPTVGQGISHSFLSIVRINVRQREDDCPGRAINSPPEWHEGCGAYYHAANEDHSNEQGEPKAGSIIHILQVPKCHGLRMPTHRFIIFGTSLKKLERSTSFFVAPHVIL